MNFLNKLISRITAIVALCLVFAQITVAYKYDDKDVMVFVLSIVFVVLTLANLGYAIYLTKKYGLKPEDGSNDFKYNLITSSCAAGASIIIFAISMISYLYLIW